MSAFEESLAAPQAPARPPNGRYSRVVSDLAEASEAWIAESRRPRSLPSRAMIEGIVHDLRSALFPHHFGPSDIAPTALRHFVGTRIERAEVALVEQIRRGLAFACPSAHGRDDSCSACTHGANTAAETLISSLPRLRSLLEADAAAAYAGDPAAKYLDETLFCYPGMTAIIHHRIAHELHALQVPLVPRVISELAHAETGIDIHPGAIIGGSFFVDHGTGVVIGETCEIGERVRIYQGVTLGARSVGSDEKVAKGARRHPVVEDDVVIYAGATLLGRITIGRGATIGGNVWLTRSVAPGQQVSQAQARERAFRDGSGI